MWALARIDGLIDVPRGPAETALLIPPLEVPSRIMLIIQRSAGA
jgi:hypothetical protein